MQSVPLFFLFGLGALHVADFIRVSSVVSTTQHHKYPFLSTPVVTSHQWPMVMDRLLCFTALNPLMQRDAHDFVCRRILAGPPSSA